MPAEGFAELSIGEHIVDQPRVSAQAALPSSLHSGSRSGRVARQSRGGVFQEYQAFLYLLRELNGLEKLLISSSTLALELQQVLSMDGVAVSPPSHHPRYIRPDPLYTTCGANTIPHHPRAKVSDGTTIQRV